MEKCIEFQNVNFSYDEQTPALNNISLSINKGEYTTIIGHNGSGKSTLAKLVIGLLEAKEGTILVDTIQLTEKTVYEIRNKIGIVFQNPDNQFIGATVRDDIAFGLENHCVPQEEMDGLIERYAERVRMTKYLNSEPTRLSGGQKQRVAIAGVLAMHPEILILDEATSMLDPKGREEINTLVREIHEQNKMTIISITHDIEEVAKSDRVIVLEQGKVRMQGTPQEILTKEAELLSLNLDVPFAYRLSKELQKKGIKVSDQITLEGLVSELCQ
ncbi:MAG: energy-coupling factor transporter ATPase [Erysipelotrichaceae bacterium]|nr:energy-coupling factor transporter ATPase [Erysipelotrichaceae bacterium]MBR3693473.1 energy-coupling factor transporter ATPase [Erysipelotrichales bacterium]